MSFLTPLFLLGLAAAAIPVAIHLIRREKPQRIMFSTLRFLKSTTRKLVLFQQIQQWLLLLMRAALIILLVLAFARPLLHQAPMAELLSDDPRSVVILLDRSLSMRAGERFERARQEALAALGELESADEAAVVGFASAPMEVEPLAMQPARLRESIEAMPTPGYDAARYEPALRLADQLLTEASHSRRRVVMISDFQSNAVDAVSEDWSLAPGVTFEGVDVGGDAISNLAFRQVRAPEQLMEGDNEYEITARVESNGTQALEQGDVVLRLDGEQRAQQTFELAEGGEGAVNLSVDLDGGTGSRTGELVLSGDEFTVDNRYHLSIDVLPPVRVLAVNGDPDPDWYEDESHWFELALQESGSSPFSLRTVTVDDLEPSMLGEQDVVALLNVGAVDGMAQQSLAAYVRQGGNLLLAPGDQVDAAAFNAQLQQISPARLQEQVVLTDPDYLLIADMQRRHPILQPLDMPWQARFQGYWTMEPGSQSNVLMQFDNGAPALVEGTAGDGRVLLFASSLDTNWSNLPLQGLYLPWVHETLDYLAQPPSMQRQWRVADNMDLSGFGDSDSPLTVTRPGGTGVELSPDDPVIPADEPGMYRVEAQDAVSWHAVNIRPQAGQLTSTPPSVLHDRILNADTQLRQSESVRTARLMAEMERPQRLWWWIILAALALLLLETWVANRTYR